MAVELICPDCGGVIGGRGTSAEGRDPCMCSKDDSSVRIPRESDSSDTVSIPVQAEGASSIAATTSTSVSEPSAGPSKLCITCGKDVTGHRRVKDSRGYQCYQCAKNEVKSEKEGTIPCQECKRRVKEAGLLNYKGKRICRMCYDYNKEQERLKKKIDTKEFVEHDKKTIKILGTIFGVLTLIVVWRTVASLLHH